VSRGVDKRPRLKPGEVRCVECGEAMLEAAAVKLSGQPLHPVGCFGPALAKWKAAALERLEKHLGSLDFSIQIGTVTPRVAYDLGRLSADVLRNLRASR